VAPVTTPAYPDATAAARSVDGAIMSLSYKFDADPTEIRSLLDSKQAPKLFKRSDRPSVPIVPDVTETQEAPVDLDEQRAALYEAEVRDKYDADQMKSMLGSGKAMKNAGGDASYPINDAEDLHNAIHAVGRGGADHDSIRQHIIKRAEALGLMKLIPDSWTGGDALAEKKSVDEDTEARDKSVNAAKPSTEDADKADDEDEEDGDEDESGKGVEGERSDETEAEERTEEAPAAEEHQPAGTTDHGHKVSSADENRRRLTELLGKRYDPYTGQGED
jgi:hypothetical protein